MKQFVRKITCNLVSQFEKASFYGSGNKHTEQMQVMNALGRDLNERIQSTQNTIIDSNLKTVQSAQVHKYANCSLDQKVRRN